MKRLKNTVVIGLILVIVLFSFTACNGSGRESHPRGPLDVTKVTYLVYRGGICAVDMYVITDDLKVVKYEINPEGDKSYDYFAGELPSEDRYEVTESEISDLDWSSIVNVLTRVNFLELKEDTSTKETIYDGSSSYIRVETKDAVNTSGGYMAGYDKDSESVRFAEAKEMITNAIKGLK